MSTRLLNDLFDPDCVAEFRSQTNRSYLCVPPCCSMQPSLMSPPPTLIQDTIAELRNAFKSLIPTTQHLPITSTKMSSLHSIETRHFINNQVNTISYKHLPLLTYKSFISISTHPTPGINIQSATPPPTISSPLSMKPTPPSSTRPSLPHEKHSKVHGVPTPAPNVQNAC